MSRATLEPRGCVVVRQSCGVLTQNRFHYQLGINPSKKTPVIKCSETGRIWTISWQQLVQLAIDDGIAIPNIEGDLEP